MVCRKRFESVKEVQYTQREEAKNHDPQSAHMSSSDDDSNYVIQKIQIILLVRLTTKLPKHQSKFTISSVTCLFTIAIKLSIFLYDPYFRSNEK